MQEVSLQRVGPLAGLGDLLGEFGVSLDAALDGSGIAADELVAEARFPLAVLVGVLEQAAVLAACPHLGLLLGLRTDHRALGIIGEMMTRAPTLGDAFRDYVGVQLGYSRGAVVYLQRVGDDYVVGYGLYGAGTRFGRQIYDLVLAIGCNMIRNLSAGRVQPLGALQSTSPPENPGLYRSLLKLPILFDQEQTGVFVSASSMATPLPGANAAERQRLRGAIQKAAQGDLDDPAARVRHALRPRLMIGEADRERVASDLGIGERTLSRHLAAVGTSFEAIKDEVRFAVARELLALTRLPVGQVASALSYATNSAFDHAFQRWAGVAPSVWRAQQWTGGQRAGSPSVEGSPVATPWATPGAPAE